MIKGLNLYSICIWTENPEKLSKFYEEILGLEVDRKLNLPDDTGTIFKIGNMRLFVGYHDKVKGNTKDPYRMMPGFGVDSVEEAYDELSKKGVEFIRKPSISPEGTYYAATAVDPEGNIFQFFSSNP